MCVCVYVYIVYVESAHINRSVKIAENRTRIINNYTERTFSIALISIVKSQNFLKIQLRFAACVRREKSFAVEVLSAMTREIYLATNTG